MNTTGCFCTGKCKELGYCPNHPRSDYRPINWMVDWDKTGINPMSPKEFVRLKEFFQSKTPANFQPCKDPEHNPPSHLYIESGHYYFHVCPSCKMQFLISGPPISL